VGKLKVVIAEDVDNYRVIYDSVLNDDSFEKRFANNGIEAVRTYVEWPPDLVIMDIMMPLMSGYVALKEIREMERESGKNTTIIMASSMSDSSDIEDCAKVGIQGYILKPFEHEGFAEKIIKYHELHLSVKKLAAKKNKPL
jgi:CheY-like chemotaxis protein